MIELEKTDDLSDAVDAINLLLLESSEWRLLRPNQSEIEMQAGQFEFAIEYQKLIFSFWTDELSQSWRVTRYELRPGRMKLRVSRQMGMVEATFELRAANQAADDEETLSTPQRRRKFEQLICALMEANLPSVS